MKANIVKCSNRFSIPKVNLKKRNFRDKESVRAFDNDVNLIYLPVCKSAVCVFRTLVLKCP